MKQLPICHELENLNLTNSFCTTSQKGLCQSDFGLLFTLEFFNNSTQGFALYLKAFLGGLVY